MNVTFNIYMTGVGGQGIGLLSEILARAADNAGLSVHGCDTHGLAQRGGMVTSHLRLGAVHSPLIPDGEADLVISLERTEALRATITMLKVAGTLLWYDTTLQALDVRMGHNPPVAVDEVIAAADARDAAAYKVLRDDLPDPRMQNVAIVAELVRRRLVPGLELAHVEAAMADLMGGEALKANMLVLSA